MTPSDDSNNDDIWSRPKKRPTPQGPPNLDDLLMDLKKQFFGGKKFAKKPASKSGSDDGEGAGKVLMTLILAAIVVIWIASGFFVVKPAQRAVVLRFGAIERTENPGLHWVPRIIESTYILDVQRIAAYSYEAQMLTKDENIVDVSLSVQFRIANPKAFLFSVEDPINSLQQATASALRQVVGQTTLDEILTTGRAVLRTAVEKQLRTTLARYNTGLEITDVNLLPAKPPEQVTDAFDDAINAREDEQRYINQAEAYAQKVVPIAKGQAARIRKEADAYKQQVILHAQGDIARFTAMLNAHRQWPKVTETRLYFDTLQSVLGDTAKVFVDVKGASPLLYLPIERLLKKQGLSTVHQGGKVRSVSESAAETNYRPDYSNMGSAK